MRVSARSTGGTGTALDRAAAAPYLRGAVAAGAALLWSNVLLPRTGLRRRGRTVANVVVATGCARALRGQPNWLSGRGLRWGALAAGAVGTAYATGVAVPAIRDRMAEFADRDAEVGTVEWLAIHIPLGTVYSEELIFRATLDPILETALGRGGKWCSAVVFGLWHIYPARASGDGVTATVAVTAAGGMLFSWLRRHTGSATAPALAHLALNVGGALAPRAAQWCAGRHSGPPRSVAGPRDARRRSGRIADLGADRPGRNN